MDDIDVRDIAKLKQALVLSERQRRVDTFTPLGNRKGSALSRDSKAKTVVTARDVANNVIHLKHLIQTCTSLDRGKKKTLARIEGEHHAWKLKHKGLIDNCKISEMEETFVHPPGFRYHANGDTRIVQKDAIDPKRRVSTRAIYELTSGKACHKEEEKLHQEFKREIEETERALEDIKSSKELNDINKRINKVRSSLTFLRAHANDRYPQPKSYYNSSLFEKKKEPRRGRYLKPNCAACENRLKDDLNFALNQKVSASSYHQRWQPAPRGYFCSSDLSVKSSTFFKRTTRHCGKKTESYSSMKERNTTTSAPVFGLTKRNPEAMLHVPLFKTESTPATLNRKGIPKSPLAMSPRSMAGLRLKNNRPVPIPSDDALSDEGGLGDTALTVRALRKVETLQDIEKMKMEVCNSKMDDFLAKLPPAKVTIERWRSSTGVQMKHDSNQMPQRAAGYETMNTDAKQNHKQKSSSDYVTSTDVVRSAVAKHPLGSVLSAPRLTDSPTWRATLGSLGPGSETLALCHQVLNRNSVEELINCRYLRVNSSEQLGQIMVE